MTTAGCVRPARRKPEGEIPDGGGRYLLWEQKRLAVRCTSRRPASDAACGCDRYHGHGRGCGSHVRRESRRRHGHNDCQVHGSEGWEHSGRRKAVDLDSGRRPGRRSAGGREPHQVPGVRRAHPGSQEQGSLPNRRQIRCHKEHLTIGPPRPDPAKVRRLWTQPPLRRLPTILCSLNFSSCNTLVDTESRPVAGVGSLAYPAPCGKSATMNGTELRDRPWLLLQSGAARVGLGMFRLCRRRNRSRRDRGAFCAVWPRKRGYQPDSHLSDEW